VRQKRYFLFFFLVIWFFTGTDLQAQRVDLAAMRKTWHDATILEAVGDWQKALTLYESVAEQTSSMPLQIREWYRGTASFALARCYGRLQDTAKAKAAMTYALEHHFWNPLVLRIDSNLIQVCRPQWIDSMINSWQEIRVLESSFWTPQPPVFVYPDKITPGEKLPLIVALHGGNASYFEFAEQWTAVANDLHVAVMVPAGIVRESEVTNSWETDFVRIDSLVNVQLLQCLNNPVLDLNNIYLSGYSQGAQSAIYLSLQRPERYKGVILFSSFAQHGLDERQLQNVLAKKVKFYTFVGEYEEPMFESSIRDAYTRMTQLGIPFMLEKVKGMCHEVPLDLKTKFRTAIDWMKAVEAHDEDDR